VAALFGVLVAPVAVRLRGLYLAIVTLGLVFLGEHVFREWTSLTGGPGVGRPAAVPELFGVRLDQDNAVFTAAQQLYLLMFVLLVIFGVLARNLVRSRVGRARWGRAAGPSGGTAPPSRHSGAGPYFASIFFAMAT